MPSENRFRLFAALFAVLLLLAFDCLVVYPVLLWRNFYWQPDVPVVDQDRGESPANLLPHPRWIWSYRPGSRYRVRSASEGADLEVAINTLGFRDEEPNTRPPDCRTFVALGDSFGFGWLVPHRDRWDEVLARSLSTPEAPHCSENLAMWASTFDQHALILEEKLPEDARLVVHLVYPSHAQTILRHRLERDGETVRSVSDPLLHVVGNRLLYGASPAEVVEKRLSFPFTICVARYLYRKHRFKKAVQRVRAALDDRELYRAATIDRAADGWEKTEWAIRHISELTRARGIPYVVVLVPRDFQLSPVEWNGAEPDPEILSTDLPQDRIRKLCEATGWATVVDLLPVMRAEYRPELYFRTDPHWRPAGHALAAREILAHLRRRGLTN